MTRHPPNTTSTYPLFPYSTPFRSSPPGRGRGTTGRVVEGHGRSRAVDRAGNTSRAPPPCFAWSPSPQGGGSSAHTRQGVTRHIKPRHQLDHAGKGTTLRPDLPLPPQPFRLYSRHNQGNYAATWENGGGGKRCVEGV